MNIGDNINDGNWHYIAATTDGSTSVQFYVDGQQVGVPLSRASQRRAVPGNRIGTG